jgi:integrase
MAEYVRKTARYEGKKFEAYGKTEREAMTKLAEKLAAAKRGEGIASENMTVDQWYKHWIEVYKKPKGLTEKSLKMYDEKYNNHIKPRIGRLRLKDVKEVALQRIMNEQAGMSDSHVKKVRMVLQEMFKRARISRLIIYDPAEDLQIPQATKGRRRAITEEERKGILEVAETHPAGLWILTLLYTGMRPGETATLTWADVDFTADEIRIHHARESGSTRVKSTKTKAGVRVLPHIPEAIMGKLKAQREGKQPFDLVFPNRDGKLMDEATMYRRWKSFRRELDIHMGATVYRNQITESKLADDLVPYCLRHTFATDCARAGVPIDTVRWLMGHEDISITANIYQDADKTALKNGLMMLDRESIAV